MIPSMAGSRTYVGPAYYDSRQLVTSTLLFKGGLADRLARQKLLL